MTAPRPWLPGPAGVVILAGVAAALHVAKLAPALPTLRESLGLSLAQAGWLLSTVQGAGMLLGAVMGVLADGWGLRRCMLTGLVLLTLASAGGPAGPGFEALLALRALEGLGFLMATMPAAALVRRLASGQAIGVPVMPGAEIGGRHIVYVDVTGIVGYANIAALVCDCEADLHHGGAHSESCPLFGAS